MIKITFLNFILIFVALLGIAVLIKLVQNGYYAALLPMVCIMAYVPLSIIWAYSGNKLHIGVLFNTAWSLLHLGFIGGYSWVLWQVHKDLKKRYEECCYAMEMSRKEEPFL